MILATSQACSLGLQEERATVIDQFGNVHHEQPIVLLREASFEEYVADFTQRNPSDSRNRVLSPDGWFFYEVHSD